MEKANIKYSLLGHKARCFDIRVNKGHKKALSASEDGTVRFWDLSSRKTINTFQHNLESEVLRCAFIDPDEGKVICTAGADGKAIIWGINGQNESDSKHSYEKLCTLNHGEKYQLQNSSIYSLTHACACSGNTQIYSCELLENWSSAQVLSLK